MAALPYIQLYVADYLADTVHLETDEHGAYLLLIMNYWQTGRPIPEKRVQKITGLSNERYTDVEQTLVEFFEVIDGYWHHARIDYDLEHVLAKSHAASRAGKKSAEKRKLQAIEKQKELNGRSTTVQRTCNHTDTDTDTDTDTLNNIGAKAPPRKQFKPPDINQVNEYLVERCASQVDGQQFIDHHEARGWIMSNRQKMKDWKAGLRTWIANDKKFNNNLGKSYEQRDTRNRAERCHDAICNLPDD